MNRHLFRFLGHYLTMTALAPDSAVAIAPSEPSSPGPDADGFAEPDWSQGEFADGIPPASASSPAGEPEPNLVGGAGVTPPTPPTPVATPPVPQPVAPNALPAAPAPTATPADPQTPPATPPVPQPPTPNPLEDPEYEANTVRTLAGGYALTAEQAERIHTEPENVLPELAGRLHFNMVLSNAAMIDQHMVQFREKVLPGLIQEAITQHTTAQTVNANVERDIFTPYPELRSVPKATLKSMAASIDEMLKGQPGPAKLQALVTTVYSILGKPVPTFAAAPAAPQQPTAQQPWRPANPGSVPPPAPPPSNNPGSVWDQFNDSL